MAMANGQGHSICVDRLVPVPAGVSENPGLDRLDRAVVPGRTNLLVTVFPYVFL